MSALIGHWVYSLQSLPIEGLGELCWSRKAATRVANGSVIEPPQWELKFQPDPTMPLPDDFISRLACFANTSASAVESQYRDWLHSFESASFTVSIPGAGELIKVEEGHVQWKPTQNFYGEMASVRVLPLAADYLYRRWDISSRFILLLTGIALAYILFLGVQKGVEIDQTRSKWPVNKVIPQIDLLPYREIR